MFYYNCCLFKVILICISKKSIPYFLFFLHSFLIKNRGFLITHTQQCNIFHQNKPQACYISNKGKFYLLSEHLDYNSFALPWSNCFYFKRLRKRLGQVFCYMLSFTAFFVYIWKQNTQYNKHNVSHIYLNKKICY